MDTGARQTLDCPIVFQARVQPHAAALGCGSRSISYEELNRAISATVERLRDLGLPAGARVAVISRNDPEYIIVLFALWRMGCVSVLLSHRLPPAALAAEVMRLGCLVLLTSTPAVLALPGVMVKSYLFTNVVVHGMSGGHPAGAVSYGVDQPLAVVLTSGSQGPAKAALLSAGNFYFNAVGGNGNMPFGSGDRWLLSLPLFHVGGLGILWRSVIGGGTVVILEEGEDWEVPLTSAKITHLSLVPTQLFRLMKRPGGVAAAASLKAVLVGGAPIPAGLLARAAAAGIPVHITYGLTEMASQVATSSTLTAATLTDRRALALAHREAIISSQGEVLVKGPCLFLGYVTAGGVARPVDAGGWFATGDLGEMDARGALKITGRRDNLFICGGENIQPEEIEAYMLSFPGIEAAAVIPLPDEEFGMVPLAFIRTAPSTTITGAAVTAHLRKYLPAFKVPRSFYVWPDTAEGNGLKVSRPVLKNILMERNAHGPHSM